MEPLPLSRADFVVQTSDGDLLAVIEIKNAKNLTPAWAASIRADLLRHSRVNRAARFFLVLSQDVGYLWDQGESLSAEETLPTASFPMGQVIDRYLSSHTEQGRLSGQEVALAVLYWLSDLTRADATHLLGESLPADASVFLKLIEGGHVNVELAA